MALILKGRAKLKGSTVIGKRPYAIDGVFNPELVLDFQKEFYRTNAVSKTFPNAITHTRASTATYVDSTGTLQTAAINEPRLGHHVYNGTAWVNEGLLHESEARTNLLLNSGTLATQSVTVSAVAHTIHFTGTGTITLSGASAAGPLVGTGTGESNRVSLTFTPIAAPLIITVTGTVTNAQLEAAPTLSSYIPTAGTTVTRSADVLTIPAANLPYPEPVVIGPELVTNGTFDDGTTGFASPRANSTLSVVSGRLRTTANAAGAFGARTTLSGLTIGAVYKTDFEVPAFTTTGNPAHIYRVDSDAGLSFTGPVQSQASSGSAIFVATATTMFAGVIGVAGAAGEFIEIDNISVREINPLALSIQMDGAINFADENLAAQQTFLRWQLDTNNFISVDLDTDSTATGEINFNQASGGVFDTVVTSGTALAPSIATAFNIASRHGSTFINGALNGTALTADTTPVALANLSASNLNLGFDYMGTIKTLRLWGQDVGNAGISEASS